LPIFDKPAFTIHKKSIFQRNLLAVEFLLCNKTNIKTPSLIDDEASMISDTNSDSKVVGSLLDDLISYVYSGTNSR
jgi:hypothetical protein